VELVVVTAVMYLATPSEGEAKDAAALGISLAGIDTASATARPSSAASESGSEHPSDRPPVPGEWLERSPLLTVVIVRSEPLRFVVTAHWHHSLTLNTINLSLLLLGFALHGTPARLMRAVREATPATWA